MSHRIWHRPPLAGLALLGLLLCQLWHACPARADELEDFERARDAYERGHYPQAIEQFEALVGGEEPRLRSRPLVVESRKYLAASYLFVGKKDKAAHQFELLLGEDPTYQLDPVAFPREVHALFASVRDRLQAEQQQQEQDRQRRLQQDTGRQHELKRQRQRIAELQRLAGNEVVLHEHSRWIAAIPFGVGQFQNGAFRLGMALAVTEGLMAATSITTFLLHQDVVDTPVGGPLQGCDPKNAAFCAKLSRRERAYRLTNWASTGLLAGLIVYGILDAELRFVPYTETRRERKLPKELQVGVGLGSAQLRLSF